jgi:hypothetical protein
MSMVGLNIQLNDPQLMYSTGAHIPDVSSPAGFFDVLYLGIFITVSPVLDKRFYEVSKHRPILIAEVEHALCHFHSLLHIFCQRFIIVLDGEPIAHTYVLDRMLAEFAAAVVVFTKSLSDSRDDDDDAIKSCLIVRRLEGLIQSCYPTVLPYFLECVDRGHKHFLWTGPDLQIIRRSESSESIVPLMTVGELRELPAHRIYRETATPDQSSAIPSDMSSPPTQKRHVRGDGSDVVDVDQPAKRRR